MRQCTVYRLGLVGYQEAWDLQKALAERRKEGQIGDVLLLLEHPHTYTSGRNGKKENILASEEELARLGARVFWIDRGGDATYHGPGQLVGYPILDVVPLGGPLPYVRALEELLIRTLADFDIAAARIPGRTGVWAGDRKIAAIGVKLSRWISTHGFALNLDPDLSYFDYIVPCDIQGVRVTSMAEMLRRPVGVAEVQDCLVQHFARVFWTQIEEGDLRDLEVMVKAMS